MSSNDKMSLLPSSENSACERVGFRRLWKFGISGMKAFLRSFSKFNKLMNVWAKLMKVSDAKLMSLRHVML